MCHDVLTAGIKHDRVSSIIEALSPEPNDVDDHDDIDSTETASIIISSNGRPPSAISGTKVSNYERYRERLEPLVELEDRLIRLLSSAEEDEATHLPPSLPVHNGHTNGWSNGRNLPAIVIPQGKPPYSLPVSPSSTTPSTNRSTQSTSNLSTKGKEVVIQATTNWKKAFALGGKSKSPKTAHSGEIEGWWEDPDDPVHALHASAPAMLELWRDPQVTARLREKRLRLEESSGLCVLCPIHRLLINALSNFSYLDEIPRITAKMYIPTDGKFLIEKLWILDTDLAA